MFDPISKIENIFHLASHFKLELGDGDICSVTFAERIHAAQVHFTVAGNAALCASTRHKFPKPAQMIEVVIEDVDKNLIEMRKRIFALNFDQAPDPGAIFQFCLEAEDLVLLYF